MEAAEEAAEEMTEGSDAADNTEEKELLKRKKEKKRKKAKKRKAKDAEQAEKQKTAKGKYLYKAMPEFLIEYQYEDEKKSDIYDDLDESMELITGMLEEEYGDDIKISYKTKYRNNDNGRDAGRRN